MSNQKRKDTPDMEYICTLGKKSPCGNIRDCEHCGWELAEIARRKAFLRRNHVRRLKIRRTVEIEHRAVELEAVSYE